MLSDAPPVSVLVIDDEPQIRKLLRISLEASGFDVIEASCVKEGVALAATRRPEIILVDLGLPDGDGIEVIESVRQWSGVPLLVLTVRDTEKEKVRLLEAGADDYVVKPFSTAELIARMRAALRKRLRREEIEPIYAHDGLIIDLVSREIRLDDIPVPLTPKEFAVLAYLAQHPGRVVTHAQLLEHVWGRVHREDTQYLRVCVQQLRNKLGDSASTPRFIRTEHGIGYRLLM